MSAPDHDWCGYLALARRLASTASSIDSSATRPGPDQGATDSTASAPATEELAIANAARRSAVSRAYYAVFNRARELVQAQEPMFLSPKSNDHDVLWQWYRGRSTQIFNVGQGLRRARNDADYNSHATLRAIDVDMTIRKAEQLAVTIAELAARPTRR